MKIFKRIIKYFLVLTTLSILLFIIYLNYEKFTSDTRIGNIEKYGESLEDISVSGENKILAIGEGTHGTKEFQEIKLKILKKMVNENNYRNILIEAGYGETKLINDYVSGNKNIKDFKNFQLQYPVYNTKQMREMLNWIRDWNITHSKDSRINVFGFDMQNPNASLSNILEYCDENKIKINEQDKKILNNLIHNKEPISKKKARSILKSLSSVKKALGDEESKNQKESLDMEFNEVEQAMQTWLSDKEYNLLRDQFMYENIKQIIKNNDNKTLLFGHNEHIAKKNKDYKVMGEYLKSQFGEKYFAIGTSFYKGSVNIKIMSENKRKDISFNSTDPMAAQAKYFPKKSYYINILNVNNRDEEINNVIGNNNRIISVGEGYSSFMKLLPDSYRPKVILKDKYDGMIYFYETNPIKILE